jgi:hypothetical protein
MESPTSARLVVRGRVSDRLAAAFDGFRVEAHAGRTELTGDIVDQSHLYALIDRLRDLGLELVSVDAGD